MPAAAQVLEMSDSDRMLPRRSQTDHGFTLIELMIVLAVLGVLAGIILFALGPFQKTANDTRLDADESSCATAKVAADGSPALGDTATDFAPGCTADGKPK